MKTILPAMEFITQLWGHPNPKDTVYRLMKYLLRIDVDDGLLLHNTVTGRLIHLTDTEKDLLSTLPGKPTESMRELIADHFLVPESFDEYSSVKQLRRILQNRETGNAVNHYVILPTTFCNARCFYCYESDYPRVHMTEETAEKLIQYIAEHRNGKDVILSWFGGEPLVGVKRIDQISQGLKDRGIPYKSSMISNGYLFDEDMITRAAELWQLERIQITLDGPEKVYNRIKAYVNASDNPYQRVLRNAEMLAEKGIRVNFRLNVGFHNKEDIRVLIEELGERYSGKPHISGYLSILYEGAGFEPVERSLAETIELVKIEDEFTARMKELKLVHDKWKAPSLEFKQCIADNPHAIVIQPDGGFCKCEHENILDSFGNLDTGILDLQKPLKWKESIEMSDNCSECPIYPACYMLRYCVNGDKMCVDEYIQRYMSTHVKHLHSVYLKSLEEKENEKV